MLKEIKNFKNQILSITAIACLSVSAVSYAQGDYKMLDNDPLKPANQPFMQLAISGNNCNFNVLVNGIPVFRAKNPYGMSFRYPINQYLTNGKNKIEIQVGQLNQKLLRYYDLGSDKQCEVSVELSASSNKNGGDFPIAKLRYIAPSDKISAEKSYIEGSTQAEGKYFNGKAFVKADSKNQPEITISKPEISYGDKYYYIDDAVNPNDRVMKQNKGISLSTNINIPLSLPEWSWMKGDKIENNQATKESLYKVYQKIWNAIKTKNTISLENLYIPRGNTIDKAFYTTDTTKGTLERLQESAENKDQTIYISKVNDRVYLNVFDNQVAYLSFWQGNSILLFDDQSGANNYNIMFAKIDGKWKIVL